MEQAPVMTPSRATIEFVVKPKEQLFLEGPLRRLPRVPKGEAYPCQMQKNQSFSCLFRHYAKHNGLRKEDLIFSFVDELLPDQTPESVHLMHQDEICVEHRKASDAAAEEQQLPEKKFFSDQFRVLLESGMHSDVTFAVEDEGVQILAHKAILSARSEYFLAMFQEGGMSESLRGEVKVRHEARTFKRLLEFIYTNEVAGLETCAPAEVVSLLLLANEYLLDDLRTLCERQAAKTISVENISRLFLLSASHSASVLRKACGTFVEKNKHTLVANPQFRQEIELNPELGLLLFESSVPVVNLVGDDNRKRRRVESATTTADEDGTGGGEETEPNTVTIAQSNANVQDF